MTNPLLDAARKHAGKKPSRIKTTRDECELMVEYIKGNITAKQYGYAINKSQVAVHHRVGSVIAQGIQNGWITLEMVKQ